MRTWVLKHRMSDRPWKECPLELMDEEWKALSISSRCDACRHLEMLHGDYPGLYCHVCEKDCGRACNE